jgi:hypothetical protein
VQAHVRCHWLGRAVTNRQARTVTDTIHATRVWPGSASAAYRSGQPSRTAAHSAKYALQQSAARAWRAQMPPPCWRLCQCQSATRCALAGRATCTSCLQRGGFVAWLHLCAHAQAPAAGAHNPPLCTRRVCAAATCTAKRPLQHTGVAAPVCRGPATLASARSTTRRCAMCAAAAMTRATSSCVTVRVRRTPWNERKPRRVRPGSGARCCGWSPQARKVATAHSAAEQTCRLVHNRVSSAAWPREGA